VLRDMSTGLHARQRDLADACQNYEAGRAGRLIADLETDQTDARALLVESEFDAPERARAAALRDNVLERLPEVVSLLALPVTNRCR